jgi:hypothetical protein
LLTPFRSSCVGLGVVAGRVDDLVELAVEVPAEAVVSAGLLVLGRVVADQDVIVVEAFDLGLGRLREVLAGDVALGVGRVDRVALAGLAAAAGAVGADDSPVVVDAIELVVGAVLVAAEFDELVAVGRRR